MWSRHMNSEAIYQILDFKLATVRSLNFKLVCCTLKFGIQHDVQKRAKTTRTLCLNFYLPKKKQKR